MLVVCRLVRTYVKTVCLSLLFYSVCLSLLCLFKVYLHSVYLQCTHGMVCW